MMRDAKPDDRDHVAGREMVTGGQQSIVVAMISWRRFHAAAAPEHFVQSAKLKVFCKRTLTTGSA